MTPVDIKAQFDKRRSEFVRLSNENDLLKRQISDNLSRAKECGENLSVSKEALSFLELIANSRRGQMKGKIEDVVTEGLRLIYGTDYKIELTYSVKNNRSCLDVEMVRKTSAGEVRRQIGGFGGGVADTISVPLRMMVILGSRQSERVCILDECYKHMDEDRIDSVAEFLKTVADKLGMQIVICTHHEQIRDMAERTFVVTEKDGISQVKGL